MALGSKILAEQQSTQSGGEILLLNRGSICGSEHNAMPLGGIRQRSNGPIDCS